MTRTALGLGTSVVVIALVSAAGARAQAPAFSAKPLLQSTVGGDDRKEAVVLSVSIAPGGTSGRHTHPGDCYGTIVEGTAELRIEGREPRQVSAGDAWHTTNGTVHELRNVDVSPLRAVNTLVVEKGKPRMQRLD
jgi:quercetin dioxygenase-like cupin family protein